ncbi:MAG: DMT family transporter [Candidatus Micrarchaeota archaeon]
MRAWLLFVLGIIGFALVGTLRVMAESFPSDVVALARMGGAALIFVLVFFRKGMKPVKSKKVWIEFVLIGLLLAVAFTFYLEAFMHANISEVKLIGFIDPIIVLFLAGTVLGEKVSKYSIIAALLALAGLYMLWNPTGDDLETQKGLSLATLAMICGAASALLIRNTEHDAPVSEVLVYPFLFGTVAIAIWVIFTQSYMQILDWAAWPWLALLAITTAISYWAYDNAMLKIGAHLTELGMRIGISIVATVFAVVVVGEVISESWWSAALLLIGSGIILYAVAKHYRLPFMHRHHGHTH